MSDHVGIKLVLQVPTCLQRKSRRITQHLNKVSAEQWSNFQVERDKLISQIDTSLPVVDLIEQLYAAQIEALHSTSIVYGENGKPAFRESSDINKIVSKLKELRRSIAEASSPVLDDLLKQESELRRRLQKLRCERGRDDIKSRFDSAASNEFNNPRLFWRSISDANNAFVSKFATKKGDIVSFDPKDVKQAEEDYIGELYKHTVADLSCLFDTANLADAAIVCAELDRTKAF